MDQTLTNRVLLYDASDVILPICLGSGAGNMWVVLHTLQGTIHPACKGSQVEKHCGHLHCGRLPQISRNLCQLCVYNPHQALQLYMFLP